MIEEAHIEVTMATANGQVGFTQPLVVMVTEPDGLMSSRQVIDLGLLC